MKTIIAVLLGSLALNSLAQVTGPGPGTTNAAPSGVTNANPVTPGSGEGIPIPIVPGEAVWLADATPPGAALSGPPDDPWIWTNAFWNGSELVAPYSGSLMHLSSSSEGLHQHYFLLPGLNLPVNAGEGELPFSYIYLPLVNAPAAVALRWLATGTNGPGAGSWEHCAFWSAPNFPTNGVDASAFYAGPLPPAGQWVRLAVPAAAVGLDGQLVQGLSFATYGGAAAWDRAGKVVTYTGEAPGGAGPGGVACEPLPGGLAGWWQAEANALDETGWDNGATVGTVGYTNGEVGQAFVLNNPSQPYSSNYVEVPYTTTNLNVGAGPGLTVEGWILPWDISIQHPLVEWNNGAFGVCFWLSVAQGNGGPGSLFGDVKDVWLQDHWLSTTQGVVTAAVWQHVALTYEKANGVACLYTNGAPAAQSHLPSNLTPMTDAPLYLGVRPSDAGAGYGFDGEMDEITIYNQALAASDIWNIYNAGSFGKCPDPKILIAPDAQSVAVGANVSFSVWAASATPMSYQWTLNGSNIPGATGSLYAINNVLTSAAGAYAVVVSNSSGSTTSPSATLAVGSFNVWVSQPTGNSSVP